MRCTRKIEIGKQMKTELFKSSLEYLRRNGLTRSSMFDGKCFERLLRWCRARKTMPAYKGSVRDRSSRD